jgi:hypothetical protein
MYIGVRLNGKIARTRLLETIVDHIISKLGLFFVSQDASLLGINALTLFWQTLQTRRPRYLDSHPP